MKTGRELNALPSEKQKYVIMRSGWIATQTVMFITDTYMEEQQKAKNIFYLSPNDSNLIPEGSFVVEI